MQARLALLVSSVLLVGAGCAPVQVAQAPVVNEAVTPPAPVAPPDPYAGWTEIQPGGVVSMRIPPGCQGDPAAGNLYIVCPTPGNDEPTPDMHISSDGIQVNVRRVEGRQWQFWDKVVASLRVITPLDRDIQINIEK